MSKHGRTVILVMLDAVIIALSVYLAYLLRFDFRIRQEFISTLPYVITAEVLITISFFGYFKIYKRVWKYASIGDLISIVKGVTVATMLFFLIHKFMVHPYFPKIIVPRSIYILAWIIAITGIGGSRFLWRMMRDNYSKIKPHHHRALIIGAGDAGTMVVKELKHTHSEHYPIAFIDDDPRKRNLEVLGIPVVGDRTMIMEAVARYEIKAIIIAIPSASRSEIAEIVAICKNTGCKIKMIPRMNDLINGKISINMIRNVNVEDLLGREPVKVNLEEIAGYLSGNVVMVTGAGGSIGSELCRQIACFSPKQLILLGHGENSIYEIELELRKKHPDLTIQPVIADIQDKYRMKQVFEEFGPKVIFHAAAHKHVPLMEHNPMEAIKNNVLGTKNLAECAHEYGVSRFVMISTDKAVNPTNVMGATKRIAEMIVQSLDKISSTQFAAVRFGNVLGSRGSVIPVFKKQIEEGGPVTVTHPDMIRYFMTIPEAVQLVIQTGALAKGGEIFILDMGNPVKIADLAADLIRLSGLEPNKDIHISYTGIRPGEKLFEEILTNEEGALATKHDRIFVGRPLDLSFEELQLKLKQLEYLALRTESPNAEEIKAVLKEMVPTYQWRDVYGEPTNAAVQEAIRSSLELVATLEKK